MQLLDVLNWLEAQLAPGPKNASDIKTEAIKAGIGLRTLDRAKAELGIVSEKQGRGVWIWSTPLTSVISKPPLGLVAVLSRIADALERIASGKTAQAVESEQVDEQPPVDYNDVFDALRLQVKLNKKMVKPLNDEQLMKQFHETCKAFKVSIAEAELEALLRD